MSPIKRALLEDPLGPLKRLRGGGWEDEAPPDDMFEEDDALDEEMPDIPEELLSTKVVVNADVKRWKRPDLPLELTNNSTDLDVQWLDMDVVTGQALTENPNRSQSSVVGLQSGAVPVLRLFGCHPDGYSVAAFIHGYTPYAYFAVGDDVDASMLPDLRACLASRLEAKAGSQVLGVDLLTDHRSLFGFDSPHTRFLKVWVNLPGLVPTLKRIVEDGVTLPNGTLLQGTPFECNVPFVLRFMVDRDLVGAGWLTFPKETYRVRDMGSKQTHCQVCATRTVQSSHAHTYFDALTHSIHRLRLTLRTTTLSVAHPRASGARLLRSASSRSTLSVRAARDSFPKPRKIPSFRLPTACPSTVKTSRLYRMSLL